MYYPSLEMLEEMDLSQYDLVPIKKEIYSDMITPIELMRKLKQYSKHVYMLESQGMPPRKQSLSVHHFSFS